MSYAVEMKLRERRPLPTFAREDVGAGGMIDGCEFDLVEIGDFAQLLGDVYIEAAVDGGELIAWDLDVFVVVDRKVLTIAGAGAQRRDSENVGDELELLSVPCPDHGTGAREALRFLVVIGAVGGLVGFVLDQAVAPCGANCVGHGVSSKVENQRDTQVHLLLVERAGLHLDFSIVTELQVLHTSELDAYPVAFGRRLIGRDRAIADGLRNVVEFSVAI